MKHIKKVIVLGSTGTIGRLTLDVIKRNPDKYELIGVSGKSNINELIKQISEFKPSAVHIYDYKNVYKIKDEFVNLEVYTGDSGICKLLDRECDIVVNAISGFAGLIPSIESLKRGFRLALANKESMVVAGHLVKDFEKKYMAQIIPVDSEHSAIFQCIDAHDKYVKNVILTASGGPFRGYSKDKLKYVKCEDALKHPTWKMGKRITIDSATLINKGMEMIEAKWLFGLEDNQIKVIVHPQSIMHSMVQFVDNSYIGLMSVPDMRIPIAYALSYPERIKNDCSELDLFYLTMTFEKVDIDSFEAIKLAYNIMKEDGTYPAVFNAADEIAVDAFLNKRIDFLDIIDVVKYVLDKHINIKNPTLEDIIDANNWGMETAMQFIKDLNH
ncbi:MAG: 1-deoxy-D-xylulose-5-phosphate reductoisomerase [Thermoanaerobacteraceae bacterium]|nr:1-deoxy-D-xylulose-5-phosphate reductoisomerase [Thermoanaerobacteraceae bacterium]